MKQRDVLTARTQAIAEILEQPPVLVQMIQRLLEAEVEFHKEGMAAESASAEDVAASRAAVLAMRRLAREIDRPIRAARLRPDVAPENTLDPLSGF